MILIDPPRAEGHGRVWSHLASDASYDELHAFARRIGIPERGFDGDHYDVPSEWYDDVVAAGATPVASRDLVARLHRAGLRRPKPRTLVPRPVGRSLLRPTRLRPGDLVAVVSPASPLARDRLARGVGRLESWGLRVRVEVEAPGPHAYLAGPDPHRAEVLQRALTDPAVSAVWAARGGYGTHRLLDSLDWAAVSRARPRLVAGFSDLTALHQALAARLGLATLHAPGVGGLGDGSETAVDAVRHVVMDGGALSLVGTALRPGRATGAVVGGNLTLLAATVGTPDVRPAERGIAVLEDVGEQPYRLDRALTQLLRSGWFDGVAGVGLGAFTRSGDEVETRAVLSERLGALGVPVVADLPVGHVPGNMPLPLGVTATLDADAGLLHYERTLR